MMRGGFYIRLAKDGIVKNRKLYFPYIVTCICMIMMYYILYYLGFCADFTEVRGGEMLQSLLSVGVWVIAVFSLIFLYYTNSFLIRRRQKEFGLYNILGMGKRNLVRILAWENVLTAAVSVLAGVGLGILFSRLAELAAIRLLDGEIGFEFHVSGKPVLATAGFFIGIFFLIMLRMLVSIFRLRPVELLKSENVGEKPPRANWILALLGALILGAAYYLAVMVIDPMSALILFFFAVIMVIIATYFLFIAGSVALCRLLQKRKGYYYRTKHFVSLSSLMYRMKRNGAGLASICILSTMVLVTVSSTVCLYAQVEDAVDKRYPNDICMQFISDDYSETEAYRDLTEEVLTEYGENADNIRNFHYYSIAGFAKGGQFRMDRAPAGVGTGEIESMRSLYMIDLEDYNKLTGGNKTLAQDEIFLYPFKTDFQENSLTIDGCGTWNVSLIDRQPFPMGSTQAEIMGAWFIVVPDMEVIRQIDEYRNMLNESLDSNESPAQAYIRENFGFDLSCTEEIQSEIYYTIVNRMSALTEQNAEESDYPEYMLDSRAEGRADLLAVNGGLFFLGVMLGAVFLFGTVLIMYYKQISEGYEDQDRFDILMKVGMSRREVKQSINSQVLTVFFLPLIAAGVHLAFAFPLISQILMLLSATEEKLLIIVTACCYLVFALFYAAVYGITSKSYYSIVSGKKN